MAKHDCGQCGRRHGPGKCPMAGYSKPKRGGILGGGKPKEKALCFPHKWAWTPYVSISKTMHTREQYCTKCTEPKPGSKDTSRHNFKHNVCTKCGELTMPGFR